MDCPQCGGTLATYALDGREASVCEDCGYVGIPAEHRGAPKRAESWNDALRRYYRAHDADVEPGVELHPPLSRPADGSGGESWEDALRRFYARRTPEDETSEDDLAGEETSEDAVETDESAADETSAPSQSSAGDS